MSDIGVIAGEDLEPGCNCYVRKDGKVYMTPDEEELHEDR